MNVLATLRSRTSSTARMARLVSRLASNYLLRRLLRAVFTIFFVASLIFFLIRLMPSNPIEVYINELIVQYSFTYEEARDQAASLFAIDLEAPMYVLEDCGL